MILLAFVWDKTASGIVRNMKIVEADIFLCAVVWDKTASGTARRKTEVLLLVDALNN